ncbi:MAG: serine--tRNA ligase [Actinobacteria bacterium]|nr:serine--tRNA ligase [Actinomycetota bacterium]
MHDLKKIRQNPEIFKEALKKRGFDYDIDHLLEMDEKRRKLIAEAQILQEQRNKLSKEIGFLLKEKKDANEVIRKVKEISNRIPEIEKEIEELEAKISQDLSQIPNIPAEDVPFGKDENDNVVVRTWGEPRKFDFDPLPHWEIGRISGLYDPERAVKIAKSRFVLTYGALAELERALINFMLDQHTKVNGYTEVMVPYLVNESTMYGTGQLPKFRDELFICERDNLYLIPTAEVPVTNLYREEILNIDDLPKKFVSYTACFRREAGSYGKDTKGMIRVHQFNKVELVKFSLPEKSYEELESLTNDAESILKILGLPYRVILLCTGDLGFSASKTYDIEVWLPSYNGYKEISSCSNFEDFQARRMNIRFKRDRNSKPEFVHTLNGSGLAVGRTVAAILENYQTKDGNVQIPEALREYMKGKKYLFSN